MDSTKDLIEYLKAQQRIFENADEFECIKVRDYKGRVYTIDTSFVNLIDIRNTAIDLITKEIAVLKNRL
ncbi:MAG: hypothetical protein ACI398_04035 [Clostridium sp.]